MKLLITALLAFYSLTLTAQTAKPLEGKMAGIHTLQVAATTWVKWDGKTKKVVWSKPWKARVDYDGHLAWLVIVEEGETHRFLVYDHEEDGPFTSLTIYHDVTEVTYRGRWLPHASITAGR